jgi:prophage tail gpP-like protein
VIKLTAPGFRQVDGKGVNRLFAIDTLASVRIPEAGIDGTYYITQRRFREDRGKRRTELTLHEKGVWLP